MSCVAGNGRDSRGQESAAQHPLGNPLPVQVWRDAAEVERPAATEDQAQIDIHRRCDHFFGQHETDLLCQSVQHPLPCLFGGARLVAYLEQFRRLLADVGLAVGCPVVDARPL